MRKFLLLLTLTVVGFVAYTFGAKAGRGKYREIRASLDAIWNDPRLKKARKKASKKTNKLAKAAQKRAEKAIKGGH